MGNKSVDSKCQMMLMQQQYELGQIASADKAALLQALGGGWWRRPEMSDKADQLHSLQQISLKRVNHIPCWRYTFNKALLS